MKRLYGILLTLLCASLLLLSCSISKDFVLEIKKTFNVEGSSTTYAKTVDVDPSEASTDFEKYKDDLDDIEVQSATYRVFNHVGSATQTITSGVLKVGETSGATPADLINVSNIVLASVEGVVKSVTLNSAGKSKLETLLNTDPYLFRLYWNGTVNETPLDFSVEFVIKIKVTYKKKIF
jgi:hypothetical protein